MKNPILSALKGIGQGISALFLLFFPSDRHTWSAKDEDSERRPGSGGLIVRPGPLWRGVVRNRHGWAPPVPREKLPVDD